MIQQQDHMQNTKSTHCFDSLNVIIIKMVDKWLRPQSIYEGNHSQHHKDILDMF